MEVFGGLVTIDRDLNIVPDLAEGWDISSGGRTYTFHLRKDGKFHDGKPVKAHDVAWSMERATDPLTDSPVVDTYLGDILGVHEKLEGKATDIEGVLVIDDYTLQVTIDAPKAYFLSKLTYPTAFILDRENVESSPQWFTKPNGTGPFKLAEYIPGEVIRLTRNENYYLGAPKLEEVRLILSGGDPLLMYFNDELHITPIGLAGPEQFLDPMNPINEELHRSPPSFSVGYMGMNTNMAPFDDVKVRQALNYAIDKEWISQVLYQNALPPARSILPPGFPGYNPELEGYAFDPDRAIQLLKESKYGDDPEQFPPIVLTVPGFFGSPVGLDIEVILDMWREVLVTCPPKTGPVINS